MDTTTNNNNNKILKYSNYKPLSFIIRFSIVLTVFFIIVSAIVVNENYKGHHRLLLAEKNEELDLLASLLVNPELMQESDYFKYLDMWVKGHSEISKVTLSNGNKTIYSIENSNKITSNLILERKLHFPIKGDIDLNVEFNTSNHENNFKNMGFELFAMSLIMAIVFGLLLYLLIIRNAINPLQKEFLQEYSFNETILSNLQLGVALIDKNMNLLKANKLIRKFYSNFSEVEIKECYKCQNPEIEISCQDCPVVKTLKDGQTHEKIRSLLVNGEIIYQRVLAYPVFINENVVQAIEIIEDITERVLDEEKLRRTSRVQKILSQCMQNLIHSENENILLQNICQIIVDSGYYKLAWIGECDFEKNIIKPVVHSGFDDGFLSDITIKYERTGQCIDPVCDAVVNNHPVLIQDIETDLYSSQWKEAALKSGFSSLLAIPLRNESKVIGTLNIFAEKKFAIDEEEKNLLIKLADEISYGMHVFRTKDTSRLLIESNIHLKQDRDEATIANRKKSDFLAMITHEIRTPLTGILGMTELLLRSNINNEQEKFLNIIKSTANLQMNIINDILDLSKIEKGKLILEKSNFNLPGLIYEVTQSFAWQIQEKNLKMIIKSENDIPDNYIGDSLRIKQIFYNLIGNSIKFTDKGGIMVLIENLYHDSQLYKLKFTIVDTGIGIPVHKQSKIFESYTQVDSSITKKYGGTGLGTTITKRLVELMGGEIGLKSPARAVDGEFMDLILNKNPGSEFWFTIELPVAVNELNDDKEHTRKVQMENNIRIKHSGLKARILVAEDNDVNQTLIKIMLEKMNHDADIVANGVEAIKMINQNTYDIVLMDIEMPELNGIETVKLLREKYNIKLPVIALTANIYTEDKIKYLAAGMDDIIQKPYNQDEIMNIIEKWVFLKNDEKQTSSDFIIT
ncbi:MAG: response regulator [Spirochaetia bacterium]|nr:response regulator [Spirochaetia bacterium]